MARVCISHEFFISSATGSLKGCKFNTEGFSFSEVFYNKTVSTFLFSQTTAITLTNTHAGCAYLAVLQAVLPCSVSTFSRFSTKSSITTNNVLQTGKRRNKAS